MKTLFLKKCSILIVLVATLALLVTACNDDEAGFADSRYLENFGVVLFHNNPLTGEPYTEAELAELTYNPTEEERYSEGQSIDLKLITDKMPSAVKILDGSDLSTIETITSFTEANGKYESPSFTKSLEDLGLNEEGDVITLKYDISYTDGSIGAVLFKVKRIKFVDPNELFETFVYLQKNDGQKMPIRLESESLTTPWTYNGPYGANVEFNGTSDKVQVSPVSDLAFRGTEDFSVGFWVKTTSTESDPSMVGDKDWGSGSNPGFVFAYTGSDWKINVGGNERIDIVGGTINDGEWHYLAATFDRDGNLTIYQDGTSAGSKSIAGVGDITSNLPIYIGQDGTGNYSKWFKGTIGEVTVFDHVLSSEEVAGLSTPATGVKLRKEDGVVTNLKVKNNGDAPVSIEENRFTYTFEGSTNVEISQSLDFVATGDFSFSFWTKYTDMPSDPCFMGNKDWGSGGNQGFCLAYTGNNMKLNTAGSDSSTRSDASSTSSTNDGEWHFVTATLDRDGSAIIYIDGVSEGSINISSVDNLDVGMPWRIGNDGTGNYNDWIGKISDVIIYDYVLTPEQIAALAGN